MSRYMVNKLMVEIDRHDESVAAFKRDTTAFLESWEAAALSPNPPYPVGGSLTPGEREAFADWDFEKLYVLGAHPYLLWHLVRAIYVPERLTVEELSDAFKAAVAKHGRPDFAT
jgi:hypothetical protein